MVERGCGRSTSSSIKKPTRTSHLDRKTKELIAIAASLATHCKGCLEGHIKKALKAGATKEELSETIAITMGCQRGLDGRSHRYRGGEHADPSF